MRLVWCTGLPGAGKSTICRLLAGGPVFVQDADEDGLARRRRRRGRGWVADAEPLDWGTQEWALDVGLVRGLLELPHPVGVLFGTVANEREARPFLDAIAFLDAPAATLGHRLLTRTDNDYGKRPGELETVMRWSRDARRLYERRGALVIANEGPPEHAAERLLELCDDVAAR